MEKSKLTGSLEDYLEIIFILNEEKGEIRLTDIATKLSCSKPSVSKAIALLKKDNFINQERYGQITLTKIGYITAKEIYFRHKTLVNFLKNNLGVEEKIAQEDACKMEHVISHTTLDLLIKYMNQSKS